MPVLRSEKYRQLLRNKEQRQRPTKINRSMSLKDFHNKRNKVMILRGTGGLGDILMHRMMFEDIKLLMPDAEIHFVCPRAYHSAIEDHPFVDKVLGIEEFDRSDYLVSYNTTTACGRTEMKLSPYSGPHRSDIWANHCGFNLTKHEMHFRLTEDEKAEGRRLIERVRDREGPSVMIAPISAMQNKNLLEWQLMGLVEGIRERGLFPFGLHNLPILPLLKNDVPYIAEINLRQWMSVIDQSDYVISVDTAAFHAAGGMKKPLVGIFTFVNSKTYSQYYPTAMLVQGHCPVGYKGCYNWGSCPHIDEGPVVPCCNNINVEEVLEKFDECYS